MHLSFVCHGFCILLILILNLKSIKSHQFLDSTMMKDLVLREAHLLKNLQNYISKEQDQEYLNYLKLKTMEMEKENLKVNNKDLNYFLNPLVAFSLTRRLMEDWTEIEYYITNPNILVYVRNYKNSTNFPTSNVLDEVANAFLDLQNFYDLDTEKIVNGEINGIYYNTSLNIKDCYILGYAAYSNSYFHNAIKWLDNILFIVLHREELHYDDNRFLSQAYFLKDEIQEMDYDMTHNQHHHNSECTNSETDYKRLCKSDFKRSPKTLRSLHCRYMDNNHKFLKIAPFKLEILNLEPFVYLFHDVLYDEELKNIQDFVQTNFTDAEEYDPIKNETSLSERRTSKHIHRYDKENFNYSSIIAQRIGDMTGLIMSANEGYYVQKYEIGDKYIPHFDYLAIEDGDGDYSEYERIATLIIYMNDVEQGGETVFPEIGVKVTPTKGSALFWANAHCSGGLDKRSLHAGCPVLVGSKLIATYWIEENDQIFTPDCKDSSRSTE